MAEAAPAWKFVRFGLWVTGEGEEEFLPALFRSLAESGHGIFTVQRRIGQRSPRQEKQRLKMVGKGKTIPDKDEEEIGLPARRFLQSAPETMVLIVDDFEDDRRPLVQQVYQRYRTALDTMLVPVKHQHRAAVHFLVPMLEAYYFADTRPVNEVLGLQLSDHDDDVETQRHPKKELKKLASTFDEKEHGKQILPKLDVPHILSHPERCPSLRTLFKWCVKAMGEPFTERFQLENGNLFDVTKPQIDALP